MKKPGQLHFIGFCLKSGLDCILPGTNDFDYVFSVCLLLNYFLKRLVCLNTIEGVWGHKPPSIICYMNRLCHGAR